MQIRVAVPIAIAITVSVATPTTVEGANCALRNPDRQIYEIFPNATRYRSVVAELDAETKQRVEAVLGSKLDFRDLGKHVLYVILNDRVPIGLVHARSELGERGSVELVWAFDLDLKIVAYRVQRCREQWIEVIKSADFQAGLLGRDLPALQSLLLDDNKRVDLAALGAPDSAAALSHTVVYCGAKTRVITELVFEETVRKARLLGNAHRFFPRTAKVTRIASPLGGAARRAVKRHVGTEPSRMNWRALTIIRSVDKDGRTVGVTVFSTWASHPKRPEIWWAVSQDGSLRHVILVGDVDDATRADAARITGKDLKGLLALQEKSMGPLASCAVEVLAALTAHRIGA